MLRLGLAFLALAVAAAVLGFSGAAGAWVGIGKWLALLFGALSSLFLMLSSAERLGA